LDEIHQAVEGMGKRILIVDDDVSIRTALKLRLERDSFTVFLAADGDDALRQVDEQQPDLVILDLTLPYRDGLDVLAHLKSNAATAAIPVIVLTARYYSQDDFPRYLSASAEVILKPFSPRHVARRVHSLLATEGPAGCQRSQDEDNTHLFPADTTGATS
jgi:DNA-binding response OmpR family regulator